MYASSLLPYATHRFLNTRTIHCKAVILRGYDQSIVEIGKDPNGICCDEFDHGALQTSMTLRVYSSSQVGCQSSREIVRSVVNLLIKL